MSLDVSCLKKITSLCFLRIHVRGIFSFVLGFSMFFSVVEVKGLNMIGKHLCKESIVLDALYMKKKKNYFFIYTHRSKSH